MGLAPLTGQPLPAGQLPPASQPPLTSATNWALQHTPNPHVQNASIAAVSCPSSGTCMAVGHYFDRSGFWVTLAQSWDGTTWRPRPVPNPPRATGITLSGVSCTTARACTAVGFYINSVGDELTLAEAWNGTSWKVETTPAPARSRQSELAGVSCTAAHACTAVGSYSTPSPANLTLAEAGP